MNYIINFVSHDIIRQHSINEVLKYNDLTRRYGLILSHQQAIELVDTRDFTLSEQGRLELGEGVIGKIIYALMDSPYINQENYTKILHSFIELFYYYKNETIDRLSDEDLINYMVEKFNSTCCGSIELLTYRELEQFARDTRYKYFGVDEEHYE